MKTETNSVELEADGRSASLTALEWKRLRKFVEESPTKKSAAKFLEISSNALDAILLKGSSKPYVIKALRGKLSMVA